MPAMDLSLINQLGRDLHPANTNLVSEEEVCPWTLFLTMALTLLKGVMPHVPRMIPVILGNDSELAERAQETFMSEDFQNNIEQYFVESIKEDIQAPLNRQIIKSSDTVMFMVDMVNNFFKTFMGSNNGVNDLGTTDQQPRGFMNANTLGQVFNFAKTLYNLA